MKNSFLWVVHEIFMIEPNSDEAWLKMVHL